MMITSIISGGATGAERGALRAAIDLDIGYGGWRWCEDEVPEVYKSRMRPALSRAMQRRLNVQDSDATLFVMRPGSKEIFDAVGRLAGMEIDRANSAMDAKQAEIDTPTKQSGDGSTMMSHDVRTLADPANRDAT